MAGTIIVSDIKTDTDNSFVVRANTGNVLFRVTDTGLDTANSIASGSITSDMIADGTVIAADVADGSITTAKIADGNVTVDKIASDSINATKLNVSGNGDAGQALLSDGDGSFSWGSAGASGAASITLNSGTTNVTLTSASDQLQFVFPDANGYFITLPDATTLTKGDNTFVFYNPTSYTVALKDNSGTVREYLSPSSTSSFKLKDNSTSNGIWVVGNPVIGGYSDVVSGTTITANANVTGNNIRNILKVNDTQYLILSFTSSTRSHYAKLLTVNTSTKAITWGNEVTLSTGGSWDTNFYAYMGFTGDSNGVDRGVICYNNDLSNATFYARGNAFAIVSGTLYISAVQTFGTVATAGATGRGPIAVMYCGSNDAFLSYGGQGDGGGGAYARGAKVTVSGTTVTLTLSGTTYTSTTGTTWAIAPTSLTTLVVDNTANTIKDYVNYVPSTNTLTSGARTTQTSIIVGQISGQEVMAPSGSTNSITWSQNTYGYGQSFFAGRKSLLVNDAGTKIFWKNKILDVANPGTATVTVSNSSITSKPYLSSSYNTTTTPASGFATGSGALNDYYEAAADDVKILDFYNASINSVTSAVGRSDIYLHKVDPSVATFNLNTGAKGTVNFTLASHFAWYLSTGAILIMSFPSDGKADGYLDIFTAASTFES